MHRARVHVLPFIASVGCTKPDATAAPAGRRRIRSLPGPTVSAASGVKAADSAGKVADDPAWPAGASPELKLTWAVYPPVGQGESSTRNVELVARIGEVARRFPLGPTKGALLPINLGVCGDK